MACRSARRNATQDFPFRLHALFVVALLAALFAVNGCRHSNSAVKAKRAGYSTTQWSEESFSFAVANLNHLEDNDCVEMLRSMQERLEALQNPQVGPEVVKANALLASWPEPDMLRQVVSRLNQWVGTLSKPNPAKLDPMLADFVG